MKTQLSPIDYYFYRPQLYTIQFAFEYEVKISLTAISEGLKELVNIMPIISSRLQRTSNFEISLETGHEIPVREQYLKEDFNESTILFDTVNNLVEQPLIKVLISHTKRRSFVGVSFSHMLGDGAAFFIFMQNLSHTIKSESHIIPTLTNRSLLSSFALPNSKTELFEATGYIQPRPLNPKTVEIEHLFYSNDELNTMKENCRSYGVVASTNTLIMANLAKRFYKSIPLFENQFIIRCPVDYRKVIGIDPNYFGNAVLDAIAIFDPNEIENSSLSSIVDRIQKSISKVDITSVKKSLTALDCFRREHGIDAFQDLGCPGLLVSNLSKFPISKIDLGSGPPLGFYHASLNPRLALILPHPQGFIVKFKRPLT